ncbi:MAG: ketopantoate reductase family protein [Caldilineales bacterium]|nr:ketopantoate reductase family protein [Caldilineales bacterium]
MNVLILGAGALGSVYGGYLARAGHAVTLVSRAAHVQGIQAHGLRVSGPEAFVVPVRAVTTARDLSQTDLLILCVRSNDTAAALASVAHLRPEMAISFQNGLQKEGALIRQFGPGPVVGAVSLVGARTLAPGHVQCTLFGHTWFGELDGSASPRVQGLRRVWQRAGLPVDIPADIRAVQWSKLAYLLPLSTLGGLTRLAYHDVLRSPDLAYLFLQMLREVNKIAHEQGIELQDYPGITARTLATGPFAACVELLAGLGESLHASGQTEIATNMLADLQKGRPTEIEALAGDLVRFAQDAGLSLPAISFVYRAIRGIDACRAAPSDPPPP